jgi:hypothetical protein
MKKKTADKAIEKHQPLLNAIVKQNQNEKLPMIRAD